MAITVTPLLATITNCDSLLGWSGGSITLVIVGQKEGTGCLGAIVADELSPVYKYDQGGTAGVDMRGQHFYVWFKVTGELDTRANGGLRIYAEDINGNWIEWFVGGSDNYLGGWQRFVAYADDTTGENQYGTYNPQYHRYIGVRFKTLSLSTIVNCFWDIIHYGRGLQITSDPNDTINFENIYTVDWNSSYGIIGKVYNTYIVRGELQFGSTSSGNISFNDSKKIILFEDNNHISPTLYQIKAVSNSIGITKFQLGFKTRDYGFDGCIFKALGNTDFIFDVSNVCNNEIRLYGSTFIGAKQFLLPPEGISREVINCNFISCGEILPNTCLFDKCFVSSADAIALTITDIHHQVKNTTFVNNNRAINIVNPGNYELYNVIFVNNNYDIRNSSGGIVNIVNKADSNAATHEEPNGGQTNITTVGPCSLEEIASAVWNAANEEYTTPNTMGSLVNMIDDINSSINTIPMEIWNYPTRSINSFTNLVSAINETLSYYHGPGIWETKIAIGDFIITKENLETIAYSSSIGTRIYDVKPINVELYGVSQNGIGFIEKLEIKELIAEERWYVSKQFDEPGLYVLISKLQNKNIVDYIKILPKT